MTSALRILIILLVSVGSAAAVNAIRADGIDWFVAREVIYPPPTPDQAEADIERDEVLAAIERGAVAVDARPAHLFEQGRIPGAVNIPAEEPFAHLDALFMRALPETLVIIYCGGEPCDDSQIIFDLLRDNGFENARIYFGGWRDWTEAGLPVEQ